MNETKGLVKCVLGFLLSVIMMVGAAFGLDVQVNVEDAQTTPPEVVETTEAPVDEVDTTTEETVLETQEVVETEEVIETEQPTVETTEAVAEETTVEETFEN